MWLAGQPTLLQHENLNDVSLSAKRALMWLDLPVKGGQMDPSNAAKPQQQTTHNEVSGCTLRKMAKTIEFIMIY